MDNKWHDKDWQSIAAWIPWLESPEYDFVLPLKKAAYDMWVSDEFLKKCLDRGLPYVIQDDNIWLSPQHLFDWLEVNAKDYFAEVGGQENTWMQIEILDQPEFRPLNYWRK